MLQIAFQLFTHLSYTFVGLEFFLVAGALWRLRLRYTEPPVAMTLAPSINYR